MKIVAGIFDVGGVLCRADSKKLKKDIQDTLGLTDDQLSKVAYDIIYRIETGEISEEDYWEEFKIREKINFIPKNLLSRNFEKEFKILPAFEIVKKLKSKISLAALSNTFLSHADIIREKGIYEPFDFVILSYEVRMRKPDLGIFKFTLKRLGVDLKQTFFVDDREENVEAARKIGIKSFLFESPQSLKKELKKLGLISN